MEIIFALIAAIILFATLFCLMQFKLRQLKKEDKRNSRPQNRTEQIQNSSEVSPATHQEQTQDRRKFLHASANITYDKSWAMLSRKFTKSAALLTGKPLPESKFPVLPAGAIDINAFKSKCDGCLACVEACPHHLLEFEMKFGEGMQPHLSFQNGYCLSDCDLCAQSCPTGAILPLSQEDKNKTQIGHASWIRENCICTTTENYQQASDTIPCRICEDACPHQCIQIIRNGRHTYPVISTANCTGCGACEYKCPASPLKAIYVEAFNIHRRI